MRLLQFKIKLFEQFWMHGNSISTISSPQMKGAKFLSLKLKHKIYNKF